MRRLLILGASQLQLPAIIKAKVMGLFVGVVDLDSKAVGVRFADVFFECSTNDIDEILKIAEKFKPDGIITLATDMPIRSVAAVAQKYNLAAISCDVAIKATDKVEMIKCFKDHHVPHPWFEIVRSKQELNVAIADKNTPFIIKPNDSSGSRGVILVTKKSDSVNAFNYSFSYSKSGIVLIEEYMKGPEVSVEIIVCEGNVHVLAITDKLTTSSPYFVEMGHSQPSQLPVNTIESIKKIAIDSVKAIGINNSPAHVEIIVTDSGPKLVELGARLGGDNITSSLVPLSTGVDMVEACIKLALGETPDLNIKHTKGSAIRYFKTKIGLYNGVEGIEKVLKNRHIKELTIVKKAGEKINEIKSSGDRIGYVISQAADAEKAVVECNNAIELLNFNIE
jgi:biotin carboxylase